MNQGSYYGAYRQGFKTMPDNAYEMMTAPTKQIAGAVTDTLGKLVSAYAGYRGQQAGTEALQQGAAAQYSGLESLSKATGVPMNPELSEQFKNMKSMNPQQQSVFNQSLGQEAQRQMTFFGINQAKAREAQAQGQMQMQRSVSAGLGTIPAPDPSRYGQGGVPTLPTQQTETDSVSLGQGFGGASLLPKLSPEQIARILQAGKL